MIVDLKHRDDAVARLILDDDDGRIASVLDVFDAGLLPVGTAIDGSLRTDRIKGWWSSRAIPATRSGLMELLEGLGLSDVSMLVARSMGLSLTDHYWVCPEGSGLSWGEVNYFTNPFSEDVGDMLFGRSVWTGSMDLSSPDNTSEGMLMKRWKIFDGTRRLIKAGEKPFMQEPFNEVAASVIARTMGIQHVPYEVIEYSGMPCCVCDCFVLESTELVTAHQVSRSEIHEPGVPMYDHLVSCCAHHGVDIVPFLDRMIVFDFLIGNTDRHLNNFGVLRDARTLEWIGPAPLYDSGTSMGCDLETDRIVDEAGLDCKPFSEYFPRQMELVSDTSWIDMDAVRRGIGLAAEVFHRVGRYEDTGRAAEVEAFLRSRADSLERWMAPRPTDSP